MKETPYPFSVNQTEFSYTFDSISDTRRVRKVVVLTDIGYQQIYNLALLDELSDGTLSDSSVTNNDDMRTVLATVFRIIVDFTNRFPESYVYFSGIDARRNRLYRTALGIELAALEQQYLILGRRDNEVLPFVQNQDFEGFLIKKRS